MLLSLTFYAVLQAQDNTTKSEFFKMMRDFEIQPT